MASATFASGSLAALASSGFGTSAF